MKQKYNGTIIAISLSMLFLAGCGKEEGGSELDILNNVHFGANSETKGSQTKGSKSKSNKENKEQAAQGSTGSNGASKSGKRAASYPRSDASISNQVAIAEIEAGHPYTSIVSVVEGFRARPYSDVGQGFAVGNGWNMSFQSPATNRSWGTKAGLAEPMIKSIVATSGRMQGAVPTGIELTPAQATSVAIAMRPTFENPAIKLFGQGTWSNLKEHQIAVLVYHVAKVGPGGAAKYKGLIKSVQAYAKNPTEAGAQQVVSHITYGYKIKYPDGSFKQMQDSRSQLYMGALFVDPQQYRYLLGRAMAPVGFTSTATTAGFSIDTSKPVVAQVAVQDQFNNEIDSLAEQGYTPSAKQTINGKTNTYTMDIVPLIEMVIKAVKKPKKEKLTVGSKGGCQFGIEKFTKMDDGSTMSSCSLSAAEMIKQRAWEDNYVNSLGR